jgi:hypothetical protein
VGDPAFDALLAGNLLGQAGGLGLVAKALAALNAAATASELAAEASARAVFRAPGGPGETVLSRRSRRPALTALVSTRLAVAVGAAAAVGGASAAAYAGVLPAAAQNFAHHILGAPAHRAAHPPPPAARVGPDATGPAAYGLCTAYAHVKADGSAVEKAVAFQNLATAAGGAANVTAYCAQAAHPGTSPSASPSAHSNGKPSTHPAGNSPAHRTGKPSSHPAGKPVSHPTGPSSTHSAGTSASHPHGQPTGTS